jgi:hypothetical protein
MSASRIKDATYDVIEPEILQIVFPAFIPAMTEDGFDLIFLLIVRSGVSGVLRFDFLFLELSEVLDIVDIVGYLATSAGDANFISGGTSSLLLLGSRTIFRVGVGRRVA